MAHELLLSPAKLLLAGGVAEPAPPTPGGLEEQVVRAAHARAAFWDIRINCPWYLT
eukprot:SAG11_NODE_646_length_7961_cov_2.885907_1_plen_56_part_00